MRVLTYNIHRGIGGRDQRYELERVVRVIQEEEPDLICLQEVDRNLKRSGRDDQPARLAEACGAAGVLFQPNVTFRQGCYGNLLLSRWPFRDTSLISLRMAWHWPRGAQLAVVETPEGPLHLVNWHLGLGEHERHWQVRHLLGHADFGTSADLPTLIIGDSNDWRNTLAHGPFAHHGFHHVTAPREHFRTFPAYYPIVSLDKAFARGPIRLVRARVVHSHLARRASDHLPLVLDFRLADENETESRKF
ncbi:MAG: endonuclease/exonuclease/phosphatase family protein [Isosphaeraceae bacterium]|nr:endonuclease/exonuclease/phosphatase family protein [Isosphaeraceae bacterium]